MSDPKRPRRYWQFSLRTFLIMLTVVCVWLGWQVLRVKQQRRAVGWVLEMGGSVSYEEGFNIADATPTSPEWLRDFYDQVVSVSLYNTPVSDLTPLANLNNLNSLRSTTPTTDSVTFNVIRPDYK